MDVIDHERGAWSGFHDFMTPQPKSIIQNVVHFGSFWSRFELNFRSIWLGFDINLIIILSEFESILSEISFKNS